MTRRSVLTTTGSLAVLGGAGIAAASTSAAAASVADAPVPDDAGSRTYPTMGTNSDAPTAAIYGNFKCPYTQELIFGNLEAIIDEFVVTGRLNIEFRNLAYNPGSTSSPFISSSDPRMAAAGLAIWDEDPESYWQFLYETFADMPSGYVSYGDMESRASSAGVSGAGSAISSAESGQYDGVVDQISTQGANAGVSFTPQLELDGAVTAPHHSESAVISWLDARVDDAPSGSDQVEQEEPEEAEADPEEEEDESAEVQNEADVDDEPVDEDDVSEPQDDEEDLDAADTGVESNDVEDLDDSDESNESDASEDSDESDESDEEAESDVDSTTESDESEDDGSSNDIVINFVEECPFL